MKKILMCVLAASLAVSAIAQEKFEQGKPNDDNYRYLDEYKGLKDYIDYSKYPNFKLGIGTTVADYLQKSTVYNLTNKNFTETVAGNAMKMASCVDGNGNMNFETVKNYVNAATEAGLSVYGQNKYIQRWPARISVRISLLAGNQMSQLMVSLSPLMEPMV